MIDDVTVFAGGNQDTVTPLSADTAVTDAGAAGRHETSTTSVTVDGAPIDTVRVAPSGQR